MYLQLLWMLQREPMGPYIDTEKQEPARLGPGRLAVGSDQWAVTGHGEQCPQCPCSKQRHQGGMQVRHGQDMDIRTRFKPPIAGIRCNLGRVLIGALTCSSASAAVSAPLPIPHP